MLPKKNLSHFVIKSALEKKTNVPKKTYHNVRKSALETNQVQEIEQLKWSKASPNIEASLRGAANPKCEASLLTKKQVKRAQLVQKV